MINPSDYGVRCALYNLKFTCLLLIKPNELCNSKFIIYLEPKLSRSMLTVCGLQQTVWHHNARIPPGGYQQNCNLAKLCTRFWALRSLIKLAIGHCSAHPVGSPSSFRHCKMRGGKSEMWPQRSHKDNNYDKYMPS